MAFSAVAEGGSRLRCLQVKNCTPDFHKACRFQAAEGRLDLLLNKSTSANQERAKETHKAVSDSIVVNHPGASEGLKELLLRSLHSISPHCHTSCTE
ncbi:hypothetical protein C4D60_Mb01t30820 [Musa balbisiana]|uniref:Uncharacterized protein n=1 Tax=Musa balbisiana TaxID=52838 RepID=A0A4S8JRY7_MUSBA|nr:hypothetical protein C4D60_Mb01t30820 [Musa balbisiana]